MKKLIASLFILFLITNFVTAEDEVQLFSTRWLHDTLNLVVSAHTLGENSLNQEQVAEAAAVVFYIEGFIQGVVSSHLILVHNDKLLKYDGKMLGSKNFAPSIIAFIVQNNIPDNIHSRTVLSAWYKATHSQADDFDKALAVGLIKRALSREDEK